METLVSNSQINQLKREIEFLKVEIDTLTYELALTKKDYQIQNTEKQKRAEEDRKSVV